MRPYLRQNRKTYRNLSQMGAMLIARGRGNEGAKGRGGVLSLLIRGGSKAGFYLMVHRDTETQRGGQYSLLKSEGTRGRRGEGARLPSAAGVFSPPRPPVLPLPRHLSHLRSPALPLSRRPKGRFEPLEKHQMILTLLKESIDGQ